MPDRPGDMDERDVDARFASIIAGWDGPVADAGEASPGATPARARTQPAGAAEPDAAEPATADADADEPDAADPDAVEPPPPPVGRSPWVNPSPLDVVVPSSAWRAAEPPDEESAAGATAAEAALEDDAHFEPPEVELPPQEDLHFWGAVVGLVAGPLMLLWVVFARPTHSTRWFLASVALSLLGFALLVLRQPTHRDPTSGDDGARV